MQRSSHEESSWTLIVQGWLIAASHFTERAEGSVERDLLLSAAGRSAVLIQAVIARIQHIIKLYYGGPVT